MSKRDDFSEPTKRNLARRVNYKCSCPDCLVPTEGPHTDDNKYTSIGVAAHITAASDGGPRYDINLTEQERKDITNAIWLCESHAKLIDKDPEKYKPELLLSWKETAEKRALSELEGKIDHSVNPYLEAELRLIGQSRMINQVNIEETIKIHGNGPISPFESLKDFTLDWDYELVIYNNSQNPAYNLKLKNNSSLHFINKLDKINNLAPLQFFKLRCRFAKEFTGTGKESKPLMDVLVANEILGQQILIEYYNESRNLLSLEIILSEEGI